MYRLSLKNDKTFLWISRVLLAGPLITVFCFSIVRYFFPNVNLKASIAYQILILIGLFGFLFFNACGALFYAKIHRIRGGGVYHGGKLLRLFGLSILFGFGIMLISIFQSGIANQ
jgi:hypothetical protein